MPLKKQSFFLRWALVPDQPADLIRAGELRDPRRNEERTNGASLHRTNKTLRFSFLSGKCLIQSGSTRHKNLRRRESEGEKQIFTS